MIADDSDPFLYCLSFTSIACTFKYNYYLMMFLEIKT